MLKGFTVPKSPFGQAALTPPPPRRIESGFRYSLAYFVTDLKILEDHTRE